MVSLYIVYIPLSRQSEILESSKFVRPPVLIPLPAINAPYLNCDISCTNIWLFRVPSSFTIIIIGFYTPDMNPSSSERTVCLGQISTHHWFMCIEFPLRNSLSNYLTCHPPSCCEKKLSLILSSTVCSTLATSYRFAEVEHTVLLRFDQLLWYHVDDLMLPDL